MQSLACLSAAEAHARLLAALAHWQKAEQSVVSWFAEIVRRGLYRELGYPTPHLYATEALGLSLARARQFLELMRGLDSLPELRRALEAGEIGWTVAREVTRVATPQTERAWVAEAKAGTRQQLRRRIAEAKRGTRAGAEAAAAAELPLGGGAEQPPPPPAKVSVTLSLEPEQYARLEAVLEAIRKRPSLRAARLSREEILLLAAEQLLVTSAERSTPESDRPETAVSTPPAAVRVSRHAPAYQVVVHRCEACGAARVPGPDGMAIQISPATAERIECEAQVVGPEGRAKATIPPATRRLVLARDHHRCRRCGRAHFLEVHHVKPRSGGGTNRAENLVTLCSSCHQHLHERAGCGQGPAAPAPARAGP